MEKTERSVIHEKLIEGMIEGLLLALDFGIHEQQLVAGQWWQECFWDLLCHEGDVVLILPGSEHSSNHLPSSLYSTV